MAIRHVVTNAEGFSISPQYLLTQGLGDFTAAAAVTTGGEFLVLLRRRRR